MTLLIFVYNLTLTHLWPPQERRCLFFPVKKQAGTLTNKKEKKIIFHVKSGYIKDG